MATSLATFTHRGAVVSLGTSKGVSLRRDHFARLRCSDPHPLSTLSTTACGGGVHL
ncbi:uncharacterized protein EKO05_0010320 [Ascochyta rabiei]|uniref:uncharacterized protein n=1 Tax=Didymella rabiei TaxID=5454 RepID=UPI00220BE6F7|nr:uncharacterized protein EKO05_0010320 [Ascochyta rabiei]UPX20075.1 hypothetical protein EKO05_0010320 [Ascochyta rabiei]